MNKSELVAAVSENSGLSKGDAAKAVDAIFDSITSALKKGEDVKLIGFGSFDVAERAARDGKNPRTGAPIKIAAAKQVKFKPGSQLKDAVNA